MSCLLDQSFRIDGTTYRLILVDERPEMDLDPTLGLFREGQDEPIATIHFRDGRCGDPEHLSVGAPAERGRYASLDEDPQDEDDGMVLVAGQLYDAESGELVEDEA